ncbi:MAG: hypothetical protein G8D61_21440 [gamma proteobacterium symbiont of Ctena orbiculata]|nr:hypothetical protein [Candidatus Thiodiazotropha taylori]MBT3057794.1 hypothetical protein [Candidatus Thiodiazotropha sp. (ex Lucina pensylvanica)]MBT3062011.1 hypothetical protein [Candidatus Thiodiazotropha sp. (ex Lucina pensylvanica)]PUB72252.1 MAG: hypothetical protein DBP03_17845 [gamma proteobacterium symbiont of Ctena orbiculata]PUB76545.1 MAG: hypothetical protein DBO99_13905 [gamma proteobacterium symbiont of Ctena orbiculata]
MKISKGVFDEARPSAYASMQTGPLLILLAALLPAAAWAQCQQGPETRLFFDSISGAWQGEAVTTPVGTLPYDIDFKQRGPFRIYGEADPGAAIHHWDFYCESGELRLRFLSTFGGNRDPLLLESIGITTEEIHFKAREPDFLEVKVRFGDRFSVFEVLHHGERHVLIELTRSRPNQTGPARIKPPPASDRSSTTPGQGSRRRTD